MHKPLFYLFISALVTSLVACTPTPDKIKQIPTAPPVTKKESSAPRTNQLTQLQTEKLQHYIDLSETHEGPLRQQYILEMAEWLYEQLELEGALDAIKKLKPEHLSQQQVNQSLLLKAHILLALGKHKEVLDNTPLQINNLNRPQQIELLKIKAQAFLGTGFPFEAARIQIELNTLLSDRFALENNQYTLWRILNLISLNSLKQINTLDLDSDTKGWLDLVITAKQNQNNWQQLEAVYQNWKQQHPNHPAGNAFLSSLTKSQHQLITHPKHVTLLLPISGKHASAARAIRDGFFSSYYDIEASYRPKISVIDVNKKGVSIWQYYLTAIENGSDFIVGPLSKQSIDELSKVQDLEVPVLTFNYTEQQTTVTDNLFQFGLLPEDEATQIAELAIKQGKLHAAILTPSTAWGRRLQGAFQQRFEELGGEVRSIKTYQTKRNDFSNSISNLLNLTQSKQRYRKIKRILREKIKFEAYRRQDIDMIFIAGRPRAVRSIMPQLKFHQASDLQVYSTSHAFSGNSKPKSDRDINQLIYCDIPWVLGENSIKSTIEKNWPVNSKRYTRLYALGADAFHLIPYLERLKARSDERFTGYTGTLYLDPLLRLHRELIPAQFIRGKPVPLDLENLRLIYQPPAIDNNTTEVTSET